MILNRYTDTELKELLDSMVILIDTREQKCEHISEYFATKGIKFRAEKLGHADYSCMIPKNEGLGINRDMYFSNVISIERKANLVELSGNLTKDRTRLENEFIRAKGRLVLLIENASYEQLVQGKYDTQYNSKSFLASIKAFEARYGIQTAFLQDKKYSGNYILYTLRYHVREYLLGGIGKAV